VCPLVEKGLAMDRLSRKAGIVESGRREINKIEG